MYGRPRRELTRQVAPRCSSAQNAQDRVKQGAARASGAGGPCEPAGQRGINKRPFGVRQTGLCKRNHRAQAARGRQESTVSHPRKRQTLAKTLATLVAHLTTAL